MKLHTYNSLDEYLSKYIDVFSVLYVDESKWLNPREKEFFIENIKLKINGIPLIGKVATETLDKKRFQTRVYRSNLKKKEWIVQTKDGIMLPPAFDFSNKKLPKTLAFNFKIQLNEQES